jgi:glycosyltransferase involved in cell wall biosynthesis
MSVTNVTTMMASAGLGVSVIVAEHSNPRVNPANRTWRLLRRLTYRFAEKVVVLNEDAADYFRQTKNTSVRVIPNPVVSPALNQTRADSQVGSRMLVAMGRLVYVKGFDLLLRAFAKLKDKRADWELTILGEGPLRAELESLRDELGLANTVTFPGTVTNPDHFLSQADLFVMSSRVEGFPMALCEAMASGLPVICTEYSSGPREIITDEFDGLLVPSEDVTALANAMDRLMGDALTRKRFGLNAVAVAERFSIRRVMGLWEEILNDCVLRRGIRTAEMRLACQ